MTRKDFELIADTLKRTMPARWDGESDVSLHARVIQWEEACYAFASALKQTNPRFKRDTFLAACGIV